MTGIEALIPILEKTGISLKTFAYIIVLVYAFGFFDFGESNLIFGVSIPFIAALYAVMIFLIDKLGTTVYPRLHPDVACNNCGDKNLKLISGKIKCNKCGYIHLVGKRSK